MRVGLVSPYDLDRPGGVQAQVRGLAVALAAAGHEAVVVGHGTGADRTTGRVRVVRTNGSAAPLVVGGDPAPLLADVDVVHVHEPVTPLGWRAVAAGKPTVVTFHADVPRLQRRLLRLAGGVVRRRLGHHPATAVSPVAARPWEVVGLTPRLVPNAIHLPTPGDRRVDGQVVFVGRDEPRKGLDVLVAAWREVYRQFPDAELVVVGSERDAGPGSRSLGRVPESTKWEALGTSAIACAPNRGGESFGIVVVEAMAAGCAVVASDLPAFRAVAGDAAVYVPPGDVGALVRALTRLLTDRAAVGLLAEAGLRRATSFTWDHVLGAYLTAYGQAVDGAVPP